MEIVNELTLHPNRLKIPGTFRKPDTGALASIILLLVIPIVGMFIITETDSIILTLTRISLGVAFGIGIFTGVFYMWYGLERRNYYVEFDPTGIRFRTSNREPIHLKWTDIGGIQKGPVDPDTKQFDIGIQTTDGEYYTFDWRDYDPSVIADADLFLQLFETYRNFGGKK